MANLTNKEIADLHRQCMVELREGGNEATQKMLEFWGIDQYPQTDEFFNRVQLMLEQESYYERFDYGKTTILKRDDDDIGYRLGQYKNDFKAFVDQLIKELDRGSVRSDKIQEDIKIYNDLMKESGELPITFQSPTDNQARTIAAKNYWADPPYIYHFVSGDFESLRLEKETQAKYAATADKYFSNILKGAISWQVPLIHITPEQMVNIYKAQSEKDLKQEKIAKEIKTVKLENSTNEHVKSNEAEKPKSKLAQFLEKFAARGTPADNQIQLSQKPQEKNIDKTEAVKRITKENNKQKKPLDICTIKPGMDIIIPSGCKDIIGGKELPEMKVEVLSVWQSGGQIMLSTSAGVLTTRDMSVDLHQEMQDRIARREYEIVHAAEIEAAQAAQMERINYKINWFSKIESHIPELPHDDRLDIDDITYFPGYTPELYHQAAAERNRDYQNGMSYFDSKAQEFAKELVERCLNENIRMVYAGDHWSNFQYYGSEPYEGSKPDYSYNGVPKKYEDEVYLPSTCTDALTGKKLEYDADKMKDIWDIVSSGSGATASFALIGENVKGEVILVTSIDIRDIARKMTQELTQSENEHDEIENEVAEQHEPTFEGR